MMNMKDIIERGIYVDIKYTKIFDFNHKQATKLENSSYLEELTGLIAKVASSLDDESKYCFDKKYYLYKPDESPNSSYEEFITSFKNEFIYSSSNKIIVIRGRAGVGKTLFFKKGAQTLLGNKEDRFNKYIHLGVDFKNIDSKKSIEFYKDYIYKNLWEEAVLAIRQTGDEVINKFYEKYQKYCGPLFDKTTDAKFYPVMFFCKYIYEKYKRPCLIVFDNIDLACVETQTKVFNATSVFVSKFYSFMEICNCSSIYRVCFAMRPETHMRSQETRVSNVINFPLPNIQQICLDIIKEKLIKTAESFDKDEALKCEVTYYSIIDQEKKTAKTFSDVANYFVRIFEHYLNDLWDNDEIKQRLCSNEVFHCRIVNYNVRKFLSFLSDTICNGGFKPLTKDFNKNSVGYYNVFDYIEMLIRGRWEVHPGNFHIDGEGGNKAPIVFNVFDTSLWQRKRYQSISHFMLYIRLLQYLNIYSKNKDLVYERIEEQLSLFFDKESILKAVKALVFVRIIYSFHEGDDNVASKHNLEDVVINDNTPLYLSPTGKFYLENLICEFEYIYQMSLSSLMPEPFVEELNACWRNEKELTVLRFLSGVFNIIMHNIESYKDNNKLDDFISIFCMKDEISCKPYRRMLNSYIIAMHNKVQRAEKYESRNLNKLKNILEEAQILKSKVESYFMEKLNEH